ncbi:hypothetical protein FA10DRAFT_286759 [Acaromyces ingoldii]|uniref:Methyltransferase domain-containing protein n=1 Tax=Acaromyces ingoldii TaxID=215250 RepID=A0A316YJ59_9BASI|nr:hypothetical protein FA10DRAFT_286759 [Acaromyces ingoldii]PWN88854.1 hypothetical protein FA10DRAFT_286759 [Acaromyces ingoldii]
MTSSRHFHNVEQYLLPADADETQRLSLQHRVVVRAFGGKLWSGPPSLQALQGADVLDSGTGNGIWLSDLERRLAEGGVAPGHLIGVDLSDRQFPSASPRRLATLQVADILNLPAEWTGRFSLVHQRLLVAGLSGAQWKTCLGQLLRVLQPDTGCVELIETGHFAHPYPAGSPGDVLMRVLRQTFAKRGLVFDILARLGDWLAEAGFVDVAVTTVEIPMSRRREDGHEAGENFFRGLLGLQEAAVQSGAIASRQDYIELMDRVRAQWDADDTCNTFAAFSARRPAT